MNSHHRRIFDRAIERALKIMESRQLLAPHNHHNKEADENTDKEATGGNFMSRVVKEVIFLLLALAFDMYVYIVWEISQTTALWFSGLIFCIFIFILHFRFLYKLSLCVIILIVTGVLTAYLPTKETADQGWLTPGNIPSPQIPPNCDVPPGVMSVFLGDTNLAWFVRSSVVVVKVADVPLLSLNKTPEGIAVSAKIFNDDGAIVTIENNKFIVSPHNSFRMERPNRHSLMVYDNWDKLVLNVVYLNSFSIYVTGTFYYPPHKRVFITPDSLSSGIDWTIKQGCFQNAPDLLSIR